MGLCGQEERKQCNQNYITPLLLSSWTLGPNSVTAKGRQKVWMGHRVEISQGTPKLLTEHKLTVRPHMEG